MKRFTIALTLLALCSCRAWFDHGEPEPDYLPEKVDPTVYKVGGQDAVWLHERRAVEKHLGVHVPNLLQEDWGSNVLNVWWVSGETCPYQTSATNSIVIERDGKQQCVAGIMWGCNEIYVAFEEAAPGDYPRTSGTALVHEYAHCMLMAAGLDADGTHSDVGLWGGCAERDDDGKCLEHVDGVLKQVKELQCERGW